MMVSSAIFDRFKVISNIGDESIDCWFPNGRNSVRVRLKTNQELIFTYSSEKDWRLETKDSYVNSMNH